MRLSAPVVIAAISCAVSAIEARPLRVLSYQELFDQSDLVVVATPITQTIDTSEERVLEEVYVGDGNGHVWNMKGIGVETGFQVTAVFKGDFTIRRFVLHHYRNADPAPVANGPIFVTFGPSDTASYLLFLIREPDGRYAPTGGQIDPGFNAITKLHFRDIAAAYE